MFSSMSRQFDASKIRMAIFDLDGTALDGGVMSPAVRDALNALSDRGIKVVVASGRDIAQIPLSVLKCFSYRITTNGGSVTDFEGNIILDHPINSKVVHETMRVIRRHKGSSCLYFNGLVVASPAFIFRLLRRTNYLSKSHRSSTKEVRKGKSLLRFRLGRYLNKNRLDVYKIQTFFKDDEHANICAEELRAIGKVNPVISEGLGMETTLHGISKAVGMLELCNILGCKAENVIAFGDSPNDLEVLKASGFSVGMGNAEDSVKEQADYVTDSVGDDGVATAITKLFNI